MQNVVDVACSSPPVTMNATKPAAKAVQAGEQDPFDLVLQKASDRIVNDKQSDRASKSSDSKSIDKLNGADSTAKKLSSEKNEREVQLSNNSKKFEETEKSDVSDKAIKYEESELQIDEKTETEINPMIFGTVETKSIVTENNKIEVVEEPVKTEVTLEKEVQPMNIVKGSSTNDLKLEKVLPDAQATANQSGVSTSKGATEPTQESQVDTDNQIVFSQVMEKTAKVSEKTSTELNPVNEDPSHKMSENGKVNVTNSSDSEGKSVISIARNYQETTPKTVESIDKNIKSAEISTNPQTAPPDNPDEPAAAITSASVQNTTQVSEPARLAEAPKNEAITQVADQISQMVKSNRTSVRMQLYPEELGHIDLRIVTTKDGIGVTMVADKVSTQQALKSEMDLLRQSIEQAGIQLSNLNINQGHHSTKQQSFDHRQNFSNGSYPDERSENSKSTSDDPRVHLTSSVVDYRV